MGKYNDWTRGEGEALLNIIGGTDIARAVLRGERKLVVEQVAQQSDKPARRSHPSDAIAAKHGYTVVDGEDVEPSQFQVKDIEYIDFLKGNDPYSGGGMRWYASRLKANLGLVDGIYILEHQDEIPEEMQYRYIMLPGTLLRDSTGGSVGIAYLYQHGNSKQWVMGFRWPKHRWEAYCRLARCKSASAKATADK